MIENMALLNTIAKREREGNLEDTRRTLCSNINLLNLQISCLTWHEFFFFRVGQSRYSGNSTNSFLSVFQSNMQLVCISFYSINVDSLPLLIKYAYFIPHRMTRSFSCVSSPASSYTYTHDSSLRDLDDCEL